ncbi:MAG TPA: septum formation initiator family protein [Mobilitalea sp.]|nr:septum formation initiator family protein [Mobilitalea sp.]
MEANNRRNQYENTRTSYIQGNTARKLNAVPNIEREESDYEVTSPRRMPSPGRQSSPARQPSTKREVQRHPIALSGISMASMFVLSMAIVATLFFSVQFLKLQYEVRQMQKNIVTKEHSLTSLRNENDAAYEQINAAYNLDYIYEVAVGELGMVYPNNNTVITYQSSDDDYVRQYMDIPE